MSKTKYASVATILNDHSMEDDYLSSMKYDNVENEEGAVALFDQSLINDNPEERFVEFDLTKEGTIILESKRYVTPEDALVEQADKVAEKIRENGGAFPEDSNDLRSFIDEEAVHIEYVTRNSDYRTAHSESDQVLTQVIIAMGERLGISDATGRLVNAFANMYKGYSYENPYPPVHSHHHHHTKKK